MGPGTDIYALGCVLYECLTGQLPFHRDDDAALLWAHLVEAPPPVSGMRPDLPPAVDDVVARAMAKAPEDRYASCHELVRDLELALDVAVQLPRSPAHRPAGGAEPRPAERGHARGQRLGARVPAENGSAGHTTDPDAASDPEGTSAWLSHPSFPPGVIEPPSAPFVPADGAAQEIEADEVLAGAGVVREGACLRPRGGRARLRGSGGGVGRRAGLPGGLRGGGPLGRHGGRGTGAPAPAVAGGGHRSGRGGCPRHRGRSLPAPLPHVGGAVPDLLQHRWRDSLHPQPSTELDAAGGNASDAVLSPRPDAVGNTFLFGSADRWSGTRGLLATSPSDAVGMYVFPTDTGSDTTTDALKAAISVLVPDGVTWASTHRQLTVGGSPADELEGFVQDPANPKARLRVRFDVVQPASGGSVLIAFFAPPDRFDAEQATFDRIRNGIRFT